MYICVYSIIYSDCVLIFLDEKNIQDFLKCLMFVKEVRKKIVLGNV